MSFSAVDDQNEKQLMVIWDLGRRCTFACSYCPPHRKNNWSELASYDELVKTADNLERYAQLYNKQRDQEFRTAASFTGGEPTVNPAFFKFLIYLQERYPHWKRTLTTNGFYSDRKLRTVMANTHFTTLSYHCESTQQQKDQVWRNIRTMVEEGYGFKLNIMFHQSEEYFDECIRLAKWCDELGVAYTPRVIGDQGDVKQGLKDKTVHTYTPTQMQWLENYWAAKKANHTQPAHEASDMMFRPVQVPPAGTMGMATIEKPGEPIRVVGQKIGRPCCGGREMDLLIDDEWTKSTFVQNNNFKGWNCMINWYFLYIHQEIDKIWHHQTCQVNLDGEVAPICNVSNFDEYNDKLEAQMNTGSIPYIRCPKSHCGCGLCAPKAKHESLAHAIFKKHAPGIEPEYAEGKDAETNGSLKTMVYSFDEENGNETI